MVRLYTQSTEIIVTCSDYVHLDCKFVPAGREDANVRMLGTGRPFYCELSNPRHTMLTTEEYQKMQQEINTSETKDAVQIRDLSPVKAWVNNEQCDLR